jgi:hypothetical protein
MAAPLWKALADRFTKREDLDPRLEAIADRLGRGQPAAALERQLVEEMADALRRSTEKVDAALAALRRIEHAIATAATDAERDQGAAAFNRERARALLAYWELVIHREALGFRRHDEIARAYPIPPPMPPPGALPASPPGRS